MIYPSQRLHQVSGLDAAVCPVPVRLVSEYIVEVRMSSCCPYKANFCLPQNTDANVRLRDLETVDYGSISEAYFTVWSGAGFATQTLQKTLTGGGITQPTDYELQVELSNTELSIAPGFYTWEAAVDTGSGLQKVIGQGRLRINDTGTFD